MIEITLEPQNPLDPKAEELADLAVDLQAAVPEYPVRVLRGKEMRPGARGVTWWEVVHVYLPTVTDDVRAYLVGKALEVGYNWAKRRFRRKRPAGPDRRPKCLIVHSADGAEQGSMVLRSSRHKPVTTEEAVQPPKPKRNRRKPSPSSSAAKRSKRKGRPK